MLGEFRWHNLSPPQTGAQVLNKPKQTLTRVANGQENIAIVKLPNFTDVIDDFYAAISLIRAQRIDLLYTTREMVQEYQRINRGNLPENYSTYNLYTEIVSYNVLLLDVYKLRPKDAQERAIISRITNVTAPVSSTTTDVPYSGNTCQGRPQFQHKPYTNIQYDVLYDKSLPRDPTTDWGITRQSLGYGCDTYACCGRPVNWDKPADQDNGCWIGTNAERFTREPVPYNFAPDFENVWSLISDLTILQKDLVDEVWETFEQGTAHLDLDYYNDLHQQITEAKAEIDADALVQFTISLMDAPEREIPEPLQSQLIKLFQLQYKYNKVQCVNPIPVLAKRWTNYLRAEFFKLDLTRLLSSTSYIMVDDTRVRLMNVYTQNDLLEAEISRFNSDLVEAATNSIEWVEYYYTNVSNCFTELYQYLYKTDSPLSKDDWSIYIVGLNQIAKNASKTGQVDLQILEQLCADIKTKITNPGLPQRKYPDILKDLSNFRPILSQIMYDAMAEMLGKAIIGKFAVLVDTLIGKTEYYNNEYEDPNSTFELNKVQIDELKDLHDEYDNISDEIDKLYTEKIAELLKNVNGTEFEQELLDIQSTAFQPAKFNDILARYNAFQKQDEVGEDESEEDTGPQYSADDRQQLKNQIADLAYGDQLQRILRMMPDKLQADIEATKLALFVIIDQADDLSNLGNEYDSLRVQYGDLIIQLLVEFDKRKQELLDLAKENNVDEDTISKIQKLSIYSATNQELIDIKQSLLQSDSEEDSDEPEDFSELIQSLQVFSRNVSKLDQSAAKELRRTLYLHIDTLNDNVPDFKSFTELLGLSKLQTLEELSDEKQPLKDRLDVFSCWDAFVKYIIKSLENDETVDISRAQVESCELVQYTMRGRLQKCKDMVQEYYDGNMSVTDFVERYNKKCVKELQPLVIINEQIRRVGILIGFIYDKPNYLVQFLGTSPTLKKFSFDIETSDTIELEPSANAAFWEAFMQLFSLWLNASAKTDLVEIERLLKNVQEARSTERNRIDRDEYQELREFYTENVEPNLIREQRSSENDIIQELLTVQKNTTDKIKKYDDEFANAFEVFEFSQKDEIILRDYITKWTILFAELREQIESGISDLIEVVTDETDLESLVQKYNTILQEQINSLLTYLKPSAERAALLELADRNSEGLYIGKDLMTDESETFADTILVTSLSNEGFWDAFTQMLNLWISDEPLDEQNVQQLLEQLENQRIALFLEAQALQQKFAELTDLYPRFVNEPSILAEIERLNTKQLSRELIESAKQNFATIQNLVIETDELAEDYIFKIEETEDPEFIARYTDAFSTIKLDDIDTLFQEVQSELVIRKAYDAEFAELYELAFKTVEMFEDDEVNINLVQDSLRFIIENIDARDVEEQLLSQYPRYYEPIANLLTRIDGMNEFELAKLAVLLFSYLNVQADLRIGEKGNDDDISSIIVSSQAITPQKEIFELVTASRPLTNSEVAELAFFVDNLATEFEFIYQQLKLDSDEILEFIRNYNVKDDNFAPAAIARLFKQFINYVFFYQRIDMGPVAGQDLTQNFAKINVSDAAKGKEEEEAEDLDRGERNTLLECLANSIDVFESIDSKTTMEYYDDLLPKIDVCVNKIYNIVINDPDLQKITNSVVPELQGTQKQIPGFLEENNGILSLVLWPRTKGRQNLVNEKKYNVPTTERKYEEYLNSKNKFKRFTALLISYIGLLIDPSVPQFMQSIVSLSRNESPYFDENLFQITQDLRDLAGLYNPSITSQLTFNKTAPHSMITHEYARASAYTLDDIASKLEAIDTLPEYGDSADHYHVEMIDDLLVNPLRGMIIKAIVTPDIRKKLSEATKEYLWEQKTFETQQQLLQKMVQAARLIKGK